jgi:hypothetical protein
MLREEALRLRLIQKEFCQVYASDLKLIDVIDAMVDELDSGEVQGLLE